jgi:hypothetical protein
MIFYYISAHGFGHMVRDCEVIRNLPPEIPLVLRTAGAQWFLRNELAGRPIEIAPAQFDRGTLGPDSSQIDLARTIDQVESLIAREEAELKEEVALLKARGARLVVSDVPSFALEAAREAGVPSILIANFTWAGIYQHLADHFCDDGALRERTLRVIDHLQHQYDMGDLMLAADMCIPMRACHARRDVPMIARRGMNRRDILTRELGLNPARPILLLYIGREGIVDVRWERLKEFADLQLIAFNPPPGSEPYVHALPESLVDHSDAVASVDAVIAKPGYGMCGECIATGTPLIYMTRPQFAEMEAIDEIMQRWGGGLRIEEEDFKGLNWGPCLGRLKQIKVAPGKIDCSGGQICAEVIRAAWNGA